MKPVIHCNKCFSLSKNKKNKKHNKTREKNTQKKNPHANADVTNKR